MSRSFLPDNEVQWLDRLAHVNLGYLLLLTVGSFFAGAIALRSSALLSLAAPALLGLCGSATAALTSCLDRYAVGFERENGKPFPEEAKGGKFNRRFSRWLFTRPFLGAVVAPVFIWGLSRFTKTSEAFLSSAELLGFTAFMSGLLAKSVLELIKNLFKNVFKS